MNNEKKKKGRPKKIKDSILQIEETTYKLTPEKTPEKIIVDVEIKKEEPKIEIPDFENISDLIPYIKQNQNIVKEDAFIVTGLILYVLGKLIESNIAFHLEKFTKYKIEQLKEKQLEAYSDRLLAFNGYNFIEEYIQDFQNSKFKKHYEELKTDYESLKLKTEFISKSDKVIMYKYYS